MLKHAYARWMRITALATALLTLVPAGRLAAERRQVSVESLVYDLNHPDPLRRQAAARELGIAKVQAATPKLVALAHDPVGMVRREVELALEQMEDMQALPGFVAFATDSESDIRARAVGSIVKMHLPRASGVGAALTKLGELITPAVDQDASLVVEPDVHIDPSVVPTLRARIVDPERRIRRTAIRGLGILRAEPAVPDLLQVAREDRDDTLRFEAVRSVRKIADDSIGDDLVGLLNVSSDTVRNELMRTLGSMRYRGAVPDLTRIVEQATRIDTPCILALSALADIADPSSTALFDRFKADKNEMMRLYANEGIARTANTNLKTTVSAARLAEKSPLVRSAQAFALLRMGQGEYLDELVRGLDSWTTRELSKEYLLETPAADRPALFAPRTVKSTTRAELADVMGLMGDPNALPTLQEMVRDKDSDVARAAERALRRINVTAGQ